MENAEKYAGFSKRLLAWLIDGAIFLIPSVILMFLGPFGVAVGIGASWLYFSLMESGDWQGTVGKKALNIIVVDSNGNRISFERATGRYFAKYISAIILCIGYFMVAFDENSQGLHDKIAGTFVCNQEEIKNENAPVICPKCGYSNPRGTSYCIKCGTKIGNPDRRCPTCGKAYPPETEYCPNCGTHTI